ncbi:hypothetical protein ACHAXT_001348 [Thalassiosira profunda]
MKPHVRRRRRLAASLSLALLLCSDLSLGASARSTDDDGNQPKLGSHQQHELRRAAMHATMDASADTFPSAKELRSYYYFHAGVEKAHEHAVLMSGKEAEGGYLDRLEGLEKALEAELERVQRALGEMDGDGNVALSASALQDERSAPQQKMNRDEGKSYEQRLQNLFVEEYLNFDCVKYPPVSSHSEAQSVWDTLRRHFLTHTVGHAPSDADDQHLMVNATTAADESNAINATYDLRLFADRDFAEGETVHSQKPNTVYFPTASAWDAFLHSLQNQRDACLALEWSTMKQISRPGRWLVALLLDEGVFMRRVQEDKGKNEDEESGMADDGNVSLDDERGFDYVALRDIKKGEEIVEKALEKDEDELKGL